MYSISSREGRSLPFCRPYRIHFPLGLHSGQCAPCFCLSAATLLSTCRLCSGYHSPSTAAICAAKDDDGVRALVHLREAHAEVTLMDLLRGEALARDAQAGAQPCLPDGMESAALQALFSRLFDRMAGAAAPLAIANALQIEFHVSGLADIRIPSPGSPGRTAGKAN